MQFNFVVVYWMLIFLFFKFAIEGIAVYICSYDYMLTLKMCVVISYGPHMGPLCPILCSLLTFKPAMSMPRFYFIYILLCWYCFLNHLFKVLCLYLFCSLFTSLATKNIISQYGAGYSIDIIHIVRFGPVYMCFPLFFWLVVQKILDADEVVVVDVACIIAMSNTIDFQLKQPNPVRRAMFGVSILFCSL